MDRFSVGGNYLIPTRTLNLWFVIFSSLKENLVNTQDAIHVREDSANILERHSSLLENIFLNMQLRLAKLAQQ